jgi:hypothetical protein
MKDPTPDELAKFREWFQAFDADAWDRQFEHDAASGRLDRLAAKAIKEHRAGHSKKL